jgi:MFS transporter, ACS family, hexuronate transporter
MKKINHYRWYVIGLLLAATVINYIDRQTLSVASPLIIKDLNLSMQDYSFIASAFLLSYALMQVVAGRFIDILGTKLGFAWAIVWWSVANMLHFFGRELWSFSIFRFLLGMGEAANFPTAIKAISEWFPANERTKAVGILNMGPGIGAVLAPPLVALLIHWLGWQPTFLVTGAMGFVWLFFWQKYYHSPSKSPYLSESEKAWITQQQEVTAEIPPKPWTFLFGFKETWGLMLARFVSDGVFYFFMFFLPTYLVKNQGFNLTQIALFAWIPYLANDLGSLAGGWMGSLLLARGHSLDSARKWVMWIGALGVVPVFLTQYVSTAPMALFLISVGMFFIQFKCASVFALPVDLYPPQDAAFSWGISGSAGSLGGFFFMPVVGYLLDQTQSFDLVFGLVSVLHLVSAGVLVWLIPQVRRLF